jgi:hypothetical protein
MINSEAPAMTRFPFAAFAALLAGPAFAADAASVVVSPSAVEIKHHRRPFAIQVLGTTAGGYSLDLRDSATFASDNPKVAVVEAGWVKPVGSGSAKVTVAVGGKTFTVPVTVSLAGKEPPVSFRHEVMPVFARAGCNAGACHGYSLGKNGFKLSLRGADPELDYFSVVKDSAGRRLNFQSPQSSLLLAKARGDSAHEGGKRFARGSLPDAILSRWIAEGAPGDLKDAARVVGVTAVPDRLVLKPGQSHRVQLVAEYSDGTRRDVTRLGMFAVNNDRFAEVDEGGKVTALAAGETAVLGRFERKFAATGVTALAARGAFAPAPVPDHVIDRPVVEKLNRLKITPSPVAGDEEFLRRAYLDLIGLQPRPDELRAFLADKDPRKRERLADALFERPEFVDHWSLKWGDLLQNSRNAVGQQAVFQFREFIRSAVAANAPMDKFARLLLTAKGGPADDPASVYFAISKDANDTVERVTQVFCGVRMLCARCHSHPMENWTQADYYGLASFFSQVSLKQDPRAPGGQNSKAVVLNRAAGFATNPRTGKPEPPKFLGGATLAADPKADRRAAYAEWLTSPRNPFFARGLVNRYWSYFFHRGIIDPVDDVRSTNPPINPALLDALTEDFVKSGFDARHLMRRIVTSRTYQRASATNESNKGDDQNFSHAVPRRVPAEALLDSLAQATGVPEALPNGFRAAQLPDASAENAFLRLFGKPQRVDACECERDNGSNMLQALHFLNGKSILGRVRNPSARPALLLAKKPSDEELVRELYLWSLARFPSAKELEVAVDFLRASDGRAAGAQDLMWALLNSKDFLLVR